MVVLSQESWNKWALLPPSGCRCQINYVVQVGTQSLCHSLPNPLFPCFLSGYILHHIIQILIKGCLTHTLNLFAFTSIMGMALAFSIPVHWLTTMPSDKLWCSTFSSKHVVLGGKLLIHPRMVMAEFLEKPIGFCLLPIATWPISQSFLIKGGWTFFIYVFQCYGSRTAATVSLMMDRLYSQRIISKYISIVEQAKLRKRE